MNFLNKIIGFIKNIFSKQNTLKRIETPKQSTNKEERISFQESLKKINKENLKKKIETPICHGDGLGIQNKISY